MFCLRLYALPLLSVVYTPDVMGKGYLSDQILCHTPDTCGLLSIVYSPNVYAKDPSR